MGHKKTKHNPVFAKACKITNTAAEMRRNPGLVALGALTMGTGGSIEASEARGQQELVASEQLPTRLRGCTEADLTKLGFVLGAAEPGDPLFRAAKLPPGWVKRATPRSMWSDIVDDRGRNRFVLFYKAAFYDRDAYMRIVPRFTIDTYADTATPDHRAVLIVNSNGTEFHRIGEYKWKDDVTAGTSAALALQAAAWLAENYPDHENVFAYWD